ncbi:MAG: hypothetical protein NVS4B6_17960 [Mycobacterium sp.]
MRNLRQLATMAVFTTVVPALAAAQEGRLFKDSWFWGAKVGNSLYWTRTTRHRLAPLVGGEWLITRSRGALYVSLDQTFVRASTTIDDPYAATSAYQAPVSFKDNRRLTFALLAFPKSFGILRPYGGAGVALNFVQQATASAPPGSPTEAQFLNDRLNTLQTRAAPLLMVGAQAQLLRFSVFGQGSYMASKDAFLFNGHQMYFIETGVRWNFGSSIERL